MRASNVILFLCHRWIRSSRRHLEHLAATKPAEFDLRILSDARTRGDAPASAPMHEFSVEDLRARGYRFLGDDLVPGSTHLPVLEFARCHPEYRFLWLVEYDVAFTGRWDEVFSTLSGYDADLVATHLRRRADEPAWGWWASMESSGATADEAAWVRAFLPFYRLSNRAAAVLRSANEAGRVAHFEAFVPTTLREAGLEVMDCGGEGEFTPAALRGRFYHSRSNRRGELSGTIRYRPVYRRPGGDPSRLYHPVKRLPFAERFGPGALRHRLTRRERREPPGPAC